ncbi:ribosome biogenesis regulatory protein [Anaeramoeba ignava]|uniref:Ribosome biogenesis regulatory protein n=1 Tax=Anaeramoeba ignava TaxID=1746090 RepID=A0A9Q0LQG3_ANAIG|nr:ribosome biogenesis regulatory protein [Anaeramoeba ignava]
MDVSSILNKAEKKPLHIPEKNDDLQYDIGNLTTLDSLSINSEEFLKDVDNNIKDLTRDNAQLLINKLFQIEGELTDTGVVIQLPDPTTKIPREKPVPEEKPLTKWEKFAREKGIKKRKKSRKVWDQNKQQWGYRSGYGKANNEMDEVIIEDKGEIEAEDPFLQRKQNKQKRIQQQKKNELMNIARSKNGKVAKQTERVIEDLSKQAGKRLTRKQRLQKMFRVVQQSTASHGLFDKRVKNEPKVKLSKKQQFNSVTEPDLKNETKNHLDVLDRILDHTDVSINLEKAINQFKDTIDDADIKPKQQKKKSKSRKPRKPKKKK